MTCAIFAAALSLATCLPPRRAIVSEVYYDAPGVDTGLEYVELFNPTASTVSLAGVRLEAGDGAGPSRWTLRWTGTARDSVRQKCHLLIGGSGVVPAPDAVVTLDLQNGPDALRLVWPDGATEVVGWGALAYAEYSCGAPAPDVASGRALARVPDDADLGSNALDFRDAAPSPGRANQSRRDAALVRGSLAVSPPRPGADGAARLSGAVTDAGADSLAAGDAVLEAAAEDDTRTLAAAPLPLAALAPGDTASFALDLPPLPAGRWLVSARVRAAGDESPENDGDTLRVIAGPCALAVSEIQFHPATSEGEWVEVRNVAGADVDLSVYTLSDRTATRARIGAGRLPADSLGMLAQDRAALLARFPGLDTTRVWQAAPWPALNNTDDSTGVADAVVVREEGLPCARVDYSSAGVPTGVPLEWRDGAWWPSLSVQGSPLRPPEPPATLRSRFDVVPTRLRPGARRARLAWALPWSRGYVMVEVYDLAGRRVAMAFDEALVPGRGDRDWDLAALPPGLYVVALRARATSGGATLTETRALRVDGVEP
jgi:hypothetical protein